MLFRRDPLANPELLIKRVYRYVAYRVGDGPAAEDITSETFERALRYRDGYDPARGEPLAWLIGIARRCIAGAAVETTSADDDTPDRAAPGRLDEQIGQRLALRDALATLPERDQELLALRFGGDLTARHIAAVLELKPNAVEVALHRALARLREALEDEGFGEASALLASL